MLLKLLLTTSLLACRAALAQAPLPVGDGIRGDYFEGTNFERFVLTRRDATINFNWGQQPPAPGLPAESFSVRWMAWLVPPTSGKYTFQVTVDDGIRLWLNDKLLMNEWRGQPLSNYTAAVELRAGEPYRLRVDYCQYGMDTRVFVNWTRPDAPPPPASWRNLWGLTAETSRLKVEPIPTQFLFSRNPLPAAPRVVARKPPLPKPFGRVYLAPVTVNAKAIAPIAKASRPVAAKRSTLIMAPAAALPAVMARPAADSAATARVTQLAVGETVTMPELYFNQGQAQLLAPARVALDELAAALCTRPELRLEVQGHTDNVGSAELNRQLSQQRADAVCLYLMAHGVGTAQLRPTGYGGTQPVADNADPAQRPRNRRVVLRRL